MKLLWITMTMLMSQPQELEIFDFSPEAELNNWTIVDDVVMGGRSDGGLQLSEDGNARFSGYVSIENNGGFSSVRYVFEELNTSGQTKFVIRVKGDGKKYQFRVKSTRRDRHTYVSHFQTNGSWQLIEIPFDGMYPSFRGRTLDMPQYPGVKMQEISFLISNKKNESFQLDMDKIWIE